MKEEPTNKCKEQGLVHAWKNITDNTVLLTYPPRYPDKKEQCQNCGLTRTHRERSEKWFEYAIEPKQSINGTITVNENDIVGGDAGTTLTH